MTIWVDADACPGPIKDILFRAAEREQVATVLVANHALRAPKSRFLRTMQVERGFDVADARIVAGLALDGRTHRRPLSVEQDGHPGIRQRAR